MGSRFLLSVEIAMPAEVIWKERLNFAPWVLQINEQAALSFLIYRLTMDEINKEILKTFGHQLRVRVNGLCLVDNRVLLVHHQGIGAQGELWSPPGGGMQFGESAIRALHREFREETGLEVAVGRFLFVHEFMDLPLHAVELFFEVRIQGGTLLTGTEPEILQPILKEACWMDFEAIKRKPPAEVHQLFGYCTQASDLLTMQGYYFHGSKD